MFHRIRWARVFTDALGDNAEEGFTFLKAIVPPIKAIPAAFFGHSAAKRIDKLLRESIVETSSHVPETVCEQVIRFISLLVEKNHFQDIDSILQKIEEYIDRKNGILTFITEVAAPLDYEFEEDLKQKIAQAIGVSKIKMIMRYDPSLIGGYRLQCNGFYVDASLKGQMEKMKLMLEEAALNAEGIIHG